ncbi:MAG: hypothetical protein NTZ90_15935 [Proteobacteria bacterium]|nr:hypothetical protein [Pseudomonadota bacterium]
MKKYLAIFTGSKTSANAKKWDALAPEKRRELEKSGMLAWMDWAKKHEKITKDLGGPLGKTKRVSPTGVADINNEMSAFSVVEAESHEAAAKLFFNHPHFSIFPGDAVEIMEIMPIPTM